MRLAGCQVVFDTKDSCLLVSRRAMATPLPLANPLVLKQALAICEAELEHLNRVQAGDCAWWFARLWAGIRSPCHP
jgi:hypothetical protein